MTAVWGYPGADWLAIVLLGAICAACLACARYFVTRF